MTKVPYATVVSFVMYAMVCMRQIIAHVLGVVSCYKAVLDSSEESFSLLSRHQGLWLMSPWNL